MKTYLARLTSKESFTFSTDQKSAYKKDDENRTGKESYYVDSCFLPEQTTVWGAMRYLLLEQAGLLRTDFSYNEKNEEAIIDLIGKDSFKFTAKGQSFGKLESISPVFITKKDGEELQYLVPNPFANKGKESLSTIKMSDNLYYTEMGKMKLPVKGEYDVKRGISKGFLNVDTGKVELQEDIFTETLSTNIKKNESGKLVKRDTKTGNLFRKKGFVLNAGYAISFFITVNDSISLKDGYMVMGQGKNIFSIKFIQRDDDLEEKITGLCNDKDDEWYYALSDIAFDGNIEYKGYSIIQTRAIRNIVTGRYSEKNKYNNRFSRSQHRYYLIEKGSAFFEKHPELKYNENATRLGYNRIHKIGGIKK